MRYLVSFDYVDVTAPLSAQQTVQFIEAHVIPTLEMCAQLEGAQKLLAGGVARRNSSAVLIVEVETNEDLNIFVQSLPGWGKLAVSVTPLQSFAERIEQDRQAIEERKAAISQTLRPINHHLGQLRDLAGN